MDAKEARRLTDLACKRSMDELRKEVDEAISRAITVEMYSVEVYELPIHRIKDELEAKGFSVERIDEEDCRGEPCSSKWRIGW